MILRGCVAAGLVSVTFVNMASAEMTVDTRRYLCERGAEITASYVNAGAEAAAVIGVEGRQIALLIGPSASGARYAWPSDGSGYVWWTKGAEAMLLWRAAGGEETVVYAECREAP